MKLVIRMIAALVMIGATGAASAHALPRVVEVQSYQLTRSDIPFVLQPRADDPTDDSFTSVDDASRQTATGGPSGGIVDWN